LNFPADWTTFASSDFSSAPFMGGDMTREKDTRSLDHYPIGRFGPYEFETFFPEETMKLGVLLLIGP
jgi:hypothetical protein